MQIAHEIFRDSDPDHTCLIVMTFSDNEVDTGFIWMYESVDGSIRGATNVIGVLTKAYEMACGVDRHLISGRIRT